MPRLPTFSASFLALTLAACDAHVPDEGRVVAGVDLAQLFAAPAPAEVDAIVRDWAGRDVSVQGYEEVASDTVQAGRARVSLRIVSHTVDGLRHYGGVIVPEGAAPGSLPVLVYLHGGDRGVGLDGEVLLALSLVPVLAEEFVVVVPSFRAEPLHYAGRTYHSDGPPSPWDRDVDDALALLNTALQTTPAADPGRIAALGFSRGGAVAMLMGVRDPRVEAIVEFFGPTDFTGAFVQDLVEEALRGTLRPLPGIDDLDQTIIQPLKAGRLDVASVRLELIRRSAVHFAGRLPQLQVHHGTADAVVPVGEAEALDGVLKALGRAAPGYEYYRYEGGEHNPFSLSGSLQRTTTFLSRLLPPSARGWTAAYVRPGSARRAG